MKIRFLYMIFTCVIILTPAVYSLDKDTLNESDDFMILFWSYPEKIEDVKDLTYPQLMKKIKVDEILTEDFILKYYWDEQLLEFDLKRYRNGAAYGIIGMISSFFTIVLNKKIIYHGISRTVLLNKKQKYDDSNYPAITVFSKKSKETTILALTPKFFTFYTFKDFDEKEKNKILNQEVLKYFEKKGGIIRGNKDLNEILEYEYRSNESNK